MKVSRSVRRSFARVLILLLVPTVWLASSPEIAAAAPTETASITIVQDGGSDVQCRFGLSINAVSGGSTIIVGSGGWCTAMIPNSPFCDRMEVDCTAFEVYAKDGFGNICGSGDVEVLSSSGFLNRTITLGSATFGINDCDPVEICGEITFTPTGPGNTTASGCTETALDPPEEPVLTLCQAVGGGTVQQPKIMNTWVTHEGANNYRGHVLFTGTAPSLPSGATWTWKFYYLSPTGPVQGNATRLAQGGSTVWMGHTEFSRPAASPGGFSYETVSGLLTESAAAAWNNAQYGIGIGMYGVQGNSTAVNGTRLQIPVTTPNVLNQSAGLVGITDPAQCSYYWGTKVAELSGPTDTRDEPLGDVLDPEGPPPTLPPVVDPPDPNDEDPGFGWLGALLQLLIDAVKGLVSGIINGIKGLFIPSEGFFEQEIERMSDAWEGTTIGNYLEVFTDLQPASASGCDGPSIKMSSHSEAAHPLSACSGSLATLAGTSRVILTISIALGAGLACMRILGRGLGWDPGLGATP